MSLRDRCVRALVTRSAKVGIAVLPQSALAAWARGFTRRAVRNGSRSIEERHVAIRVLAGAAAPFSTLDFEIGARRLTVEVLPWLAWYRSSVYSRVLSSADLVDLSRRFSKKVRLRVVPPAGPPLPVSPYPGALSDAGGEVLEWLISTYLP